ncbi:MAG: arginase family protein [Nocardioides sp.]|uniref:arginase family protein n=1 Tax=Nocardioides sp. TaxID=35761 RepID=UPI0039E5118B
MYDGVTLIGLPYQFGRRGGGTGYQMACGPEVLMASDAVPSRVGDWCEDVERVWLDDLDEPEDPPQQGRPTWPAGDQMTRQLAQNNGLARAVREATSRGRLPVISAGGCNSSLGVVAGLSDPLMSMFWFDAHADAQTPDTTTEGLFEGMPVSTIAGQCWPHYREQVEGFRVIPESRIASVGMHDTRFIQPWDKQRQGLGTLVDPQAIAELGFEGAMSVAVEALSRQTSVTYVHIDTDVIDPEHMRGHHHTAPGGPTPDQIIWAVERIAADMRIAAVNFTCYDPTVDERARTVLPPLVSEVARVAMGSKRA